MLAMTVGGVCFDGASEIERRLPRYARNDGRWGLF